MDFDYNQPLVSVVIPMYNRKKTIDYCLNSVLSQSYENLEIILVDDYSVDGTADYIRNTYTDKRIRLIQLEINGGAQKARNPGIKNANGEWIAFLDSDDELTKDSISNRYDLLKGNPKVDLIYGDTIDVTFKNINSMSDIELKKYIFKELCLCPFSVIMARKSCIEEIGCLDENFLAWQDDSFIISFVKNNFRLMHCESAIAKMRGSDNRISYNFKYKLQGVRRLVSLHKNDILETNGKYRYLLWKLRILLDVLETKNGIYKIPKKILRKVLHIFFEHIWG
jgi:glycosyltransferase involved in cell wall biosynthesis